MKSCIFSIALTLTSTCFSQNTSSVEIDSLLFRAQQFYKTHQDSALYYSNIAFVKAKELNNVKLIGKTVAQKTTYLISKKKYTEAERLLNINIENASKISPFDLGVTYANMGAINSLKEHRDTALENYLSAINIFEEISEYPYLARTYLNIGVIYENEGEIAQADFFYDKSLYYSGLDKNNGMSVTHDNIKRGGEDDFETKLKISNDALKSIENPSQSRLAAVIYHDLSKNYIDHSKYEEAIESAKKAIEIKNNIGYLENIDFSYFILGKSQVRLNRNEEGIRNLERAIALTEKRSLTALMYEMIVIGYRNKSDFKNAFNYSEQLSKIKDSIASFQENERIAEITGKYNVEKQTNEILRLEKANQENELLLSRQRSNRWQWATLSILFLISSLFLGRKLSTYIKRVKTIEIEKAAIVKKVEAKYIALNNKVKVYVKELDYIKSDGNYLEFYSGNKKVIDRNKLKEIADHLPPNFVQIHRSFIINKNSVQSLSATSVKLKTGVEIPVSRTFKHNLS
ncbi:tetratricopeptide repeat protein [Ulvibacter sp. MAR_2010_11]|uniref:LytTR family transcriptional regulator DNA-binding domain-containing protein n=1 Tax=Ulvibacter sp. MAR_2010_11 TaxID=1250229 RepID=UPI000C2CDBBE|nr:LytTR family transcriptional regulator DNA-binding domain-containing protein [Ulvibacter sp. MAR_2010_11]PKA82961.1 tetratricopeptide repeat protein [Ulvibacter sp. MAR_2010_11]